jgi:hypothetical protein
MTEGFSTINSTISIISKNPYTVYDVTADIFNFSESGIKRKVGYKNIVGGRVIPTLTNALNVTVSFDFTVTGEDIQTMLALYDKEFDNSNDEKNQFLVQLNFTNTTEVFTKRFYNAYLIDYNINLSDDILEGKILFSLPFKDIDGNINIYSGDNLSTANTYNATMGYEE